MRTVTNIYYTTPGSNVFDTHKFTNFKFSIHESDKGCCQFIREGIYNILVKISYKDLPSLDIITKLTSFTSYKEYIKWWVDEINNLNTSKLILYDDEKSSYVEFKITDHPFKYQMLYGFTLLRYIWSSQSYKIPIYVFLLKQLYPNIEMPNILALALMLNYERNGYGDIYPEGSYGITLNHLQKSYLLETNTSVYKRSGGYEYTIKSDLYYNIIKPKFLNSLSFNDNSLNAIVHDIKYKINNFLLIYDTIKLINKKVILNINLDIQYLDKNKEYVIRDIDTKNKFVSFFIINNNFQQIKYPKTIFKIIDNE